MIFNNFKHTLLATGIATTMVITGCQTTNPYTGEQETTNTGKGAAIGAAVGALVGITQSSNSKERKERILLNAGIGAIVGGGVGNYMDRQENKLREQLRGTGVSVTRSGDNIILNMPGDITFASDDASLQAEFRDVLKSVALVVKEFESTMLEIAGHTDSTGSDSYNRLLSESRARSVADELSQHGVQRLRMDIVGYGETSPVASNDSPAGRAQNRRVELTLLPLTR